jgi:hypothetical protein
MKKFDQNESDTLLYMLVFICMAVIGLMTTALGIFLKTGLMALFGLILIGLSFYYAFERL